MSALKKKSLFRDLGSQLAKLLCELWVCQVDLEELSGCLKDLLHKVQVLCEGMEREKEGENRCIKVRQEDGMEKGNKGSEDYKVTE